MKTLGYKLEPKKILLQN